MLGMDERVSVPTGKGKFELDGFFANSAGTNYMTFSLAYRYDISLSEIPAFVLIGFNGDFFTPPAPHDSYNFSGGWHFGGGFLQAITGGWSAREDIRYRNGPGTSVLVELGLNYAFSN